MYGSAVANIRRWDSTHRTFRWSRLVQLHTHTHKTKPNTLPPFTGPNQMVDSGHCAAGIFGLWAHSTKFSSTGRVCFYGANHVLVQGSPVASILLWLLEGHAVFPHPASPHAQPTHLPYHSQHRRRGHSTPGGRRGPGSQGAQCDQQGLVGLESLVGQGCQFCSRLEVLHKTGRRNVWLASLTRQWVDRLGSAAGLVLGDDGTELATNMADGSSTGAAPLCSSSPTRAEGKAPNFFLLLTSLFSGCCFVFLAKDSS